MQRPDTFYPRLLHNWIVWLGVIEAIPSAFARGVQAGITIAASALLLAWQQAKKEENHHETTWSDKWKAMSEEFGKIGNDRIRAEWYSESFGWRGELVGEQWIIREESNSKNCETLCRMAGAMLLKSPRIEKQLSQKVRSRSDDVWRWLYFLAEKGARKQASTGTSSDGFRTIATETGDIKDLVGVSARACLECSVDELKQQ